MKRRRTTAAEARREIRRWAGQAAAPEWTEEEWRSLMRRAVCQAPEAVRPVRAPLWRPALAGAAMLAALVAGAWFLSSGRAGMMPPPALFGPVPDSRAGEMLSPDPARLIAPGRSALPIAPNVGNPFLWRPPDNPPAWLHLKPGSGPTVFLFVRPPAQPAISR
jgi:hypothetical protein